MSLLIIDNKDSFTFNLVELFRTIYPGTIKVIEYEQVNLQEWQKHTFVVISPGPGLPEDFPHYSEWIGHLRPEQTLLGICMGHEIIATYFGGKLKQMDIVSHGVSSDIYFTSNTDRLFSGLSEPVGVGLYHSWIVSEIGLPDCLEITARDKQGQIMAIRHRHKNISSVQFHPESYITKSGKSMMENWFS
ncbi:MAG TPA: aminodeoxychorismate/anthranilate synthase component II, partial [Saprospirales bacterium]|nr:aminodeoxychorismate/anthranilate synthase component II [Saprospirales bacterium]